jgi:3-isopropylmalate/(R)-2-methylmalate dehydratase large subunit
MTITEAIISKNVGRTVKAGELVIVKVNAAMATDTTAPLAIKAFKEMGGIKLWDKNNFHLIIDHAAPAPNERIANLHMLMRTFAQEQGSSLYDVGSGICHQVMVDNAKVKPGDIFMGADSHTPTYGALNALACGVGSTDLAAVMLTGKTWLKVPETIKIICTGSLQNGASAKDLVLEAIRQITVSGATYMVVEFEGEAIELLNLAERMTLSNMVAEMGAKTGQVNPKGLTLPYEFTPIFPSKEAIYNKIITINASEIKPKIALPNSPDLVADAASHQGVPIQYAFLGSCTNGRYEDLVEAANVLRGKKLAPGVRMVIAPASRLSLLQAMNDGTAQALIEAGATIINSGCGPCVGSHEGVPGNDENVISTANRNFKGRMGNPNAAIYLASPRTVALSALHGFITA